MDLKAGGLLVPPTVKNSSCSHPRYTSHNFIAHIGIAETIEAVLILILTLGVIGANALVIFVINNRRYSPYIHQQPRYLLTSLALNDLTIGLLITPFGLLPALFHCWPYGEIFCQIQALLRGALSQQSAVILVCMAVDRYMCALHPRKYYQHSSKKGCVAVLSLTWIISLTVFGFLVLPKGYYFNNTGLMACEPFYSKPSYRILSTCALYFPTTMVLMYCYGSSFHLSRFRLNDPTMPLTAAVHHPHLGYPPHMYQQALHGHHMQHGMAGGGMSHHGLPPGTTTLPNTPVMNLSMAMSMGLGMGGMSGMTGMSGLGGASGMHYGGGGIGGGGGVTASVMSGGNGGGSAGGAGAGAGAGGGPSNNVTKKIVPIQEKHSAGNTSRSMAAISLGFIVMITPWTIQEIVTACTGSKLPPFLDFVVTWIALSNSLWNPFMYWLLNSDFRRLSKHLMPNRCFPTEDTPEHKSPCCHINSDFEITTLPLPPEPPTGRPPKGGSGADAAGDNNGSEGGNSSSGGGGSSRGGGGSGIRGGSVLGICARARTNSLSRTASQQARKNANSGAGGGGCSNSSHGHHGHSHHGGGGGMSFTSVRPDIEGLSEKYWGEILERTVSSGSLHALTKSFPHAAPHHYYAHHQPTHQQTFPPPPHTATMTTSFSKHSELNLNLALAEQERHAAALHDANGGGGGNSALNAYELSKFSSSEPKLCEHIYHDANCAKNKSAALGGVGGGTNSSGADDVKMSAGSAAVASATGRSIPDI
ncbi:alpha-2C adrenergic receptor [Bactrocera oleae]|uniref:alpha-2C adrenergic receptor n=1 Tax=Bactrocera oleae TaxID=104688 RepID=UPI00387E6C46